MDASDDLDESPPGSELDPEPLEPNRPADRSAMKRLVESEERYRALFRGMDEAFCIIEVLFDAEDRPIDYRFEEVNPAFEKHTGLHDATNKTIRELSPDIESHWIELYGGVVKRGEAIRYENVAMPLGGRYFDVNAYPVGPREQCRVAIIFKDITQRKHDELERERLLGQLRDADRRKDEFLAMLAHELRNPVGVIYNSLQLVQSSQRPELLVKLRDLMRHQVKHLAHLIDDLLDVSRITHGKVQLRKEEIELETILEGARTLIGPMILEKAQELTFALPSKPIRFFCDPTRIEQVVGNLLNNASKYTPAGGKIELSAEVDHDEVVISVRDDGRGIVPDMLVKIFDLFTQADATIDRSQGGLGIGLTVVRALVELHGGSVKAESDGKDRGARLTVRIPLGSHADQSEAQDEPTGPPKPRNGRILVVDDNKTTVKLMKRLLNHQGYEVETAYDGHRAVDLARSFFPQAVLLDIGLPGLNGYEVAGLLHLEDCCRDAQFIAISGYGEPSARARSKEAGFHYHFTKPLDFNQLLKLLP